MSTQDLIRRLERDEVRGLTGYCDGFMAVHGAAGRGVLRENGWAVVVLGAELPINRAIGLGNESEPTRAQVETIETFMRSLDVQPEVEVTDATHAWLAPLLGPRGYEKDRDFMCYARSTAGPGPRVTPGVDIDEAPQSESWVRVASLGFDNLDGGEATAANRMLAEATVGGAAQRFLATVGGEPAGASAMAIHERHAMCFGTCTLPKFRRRGVQTSLLARRIEHAHAAGCDVISVKVVPGSDSERNVVRAGFEPLFAKASWKAPSGTRKGRP